MWLPIFFSPSEASQTAGRDFLERVRARIANADWTIIDQGFQLTLTIGATEYARGEAVESLLRRADMALYLGKETGRNRVILGLV